MSLPNSPVFNTSYGIKRTRADSLRTDDFVHDHNSSSREMSPAKHSVTFDMNSLASPSLLRRVQMSRLKILMSPKAKSKRVSPFQMETPVKSSDNSKLDSSHHQRNTSKNINPNKGIMKRNKDELYKKCSSCSDEDDDEDEEAAEPKPSSPDEDIVIENVSRSNMDEIEDDCDDNGSTQESRISSINEHNETGVSNSSESEPSTPYRRPYSCTAMMEQPPPSYDLVNSSTGSVMTLPPPHSAPILGDSGSSGIFLVDEYSASRRVFSYPEDHNSSLRNEIFQFQEVREALLERINEEDKFGIKFDRIGGEVYIISIQRDSIAAKVGLKVGDKMVRINDHPVTRMSMTQMLSYFKVCQNPLKIAYKPRALIAHRRAVTIQKLDGRIGMRLQRRYHTNGYGVFVDVVIPDSPASKAGLKDGDQILKIDGEDIRGWSQERATQLLKEISDGRLIRLEIKEMLPMAKVSSRRDSDSCSFLPQRMSTPTPSSQPSVLRNRFEAGNKIVSEPNSPIHTRLKQKKLGISRCLSPMNHYQTVPGHSDMPSENSQGSGNSTNHQKWDVHCLNFNPQISYV